MPTLLDRRPAAAPTVGTSIASTQLAHFTRAIEAQNHPVWAWFADRYTAKVADMHVQQWKKADVHVGLGRCGAGSTSRSSSARTGRLARASLMEQAEQVWQISVSPESTLLAIAFMIRVQEMYQTREVKRLELKVLWDNCSRSAAGASAR